MVTHPLPRPSPRSRVSPLVARRMLQGRQCSGGRIGYASTEELRVAVDALVEKIGKFEAEALDGMKVAH